VQPFNNENNYYSSIKDFNENKGSGLMINNTGVLNSINDNFTDNIIDEIKNRNSSKTTINSESFENKENLPNVSGEVNNINNTKKSVDNKSSKKEDSVPNEIIKIKESKTSINNEKWKICEKENSFNNIDEIIKAKESSTLVNGVANNISKKDYSNYNSNNTVDEKITSEINDNNNKILHNNNEINNSLFNQVKYDTIYNTELTVEEELSDDNFTENDVSIMQINNEESKIYEQNKGINELDFKFDESLDINKKGDINIKELESKKEEDKFKEDTVNENVSELSDDEIS